MGPKARAIAACIREQPVFASLDADRCAENALGRMMTAPRPPELPWVLTAIRDCAGHFDGLNTPVQELQRKLMNYMAAAKAPREEAAPSAPGMRYAERREEWEGIPIRDPGKARQNAERAAKLVAGIGKGGA